MTQRLDILKRSRLVFVLVVVLAGAVAALIRPSSAEAHRSCAYFDFTFTSTTNSTLKLTWYDQNGRCLLSDSWRAGSGDGSTDPCAVNHGRLPSGWYDSPTGMTNDFVGTTIWGRVWRLEDKQCSDGTWRTELFIHTEETSSHGQVCTSNNDDPQCWDDTKASSGAAAGTNDYKSLACIKVRRTSPEGSWSGDVDPMHDDYHANVTSAHNTSRTDMLHVHT